MERKGGKGSPGGRPPPKRTYGSRQGSGRLYGQNSGQHQAAGESSSRLSGASTAYRSATPALLRPEPTNTRLAIGETSGAGTELLLQQSAKKFGRPVAGGVRSTEELSRLIRAAGEGGESGRTSAIALAQACKSRQTRRAIRANAGDVMDELTSVLLVSLRVGEGDRRQRDEATVHGLAVAMFVLSKDRGLVKAFSAAAVSALTVLIEGDRRRDVASEVLLGTSTSAASSGVASVAITAVDRQGKSTFPGGMLRPIAEDHSTGSRSSADGRGASRLDTRDEDEEGSQGGVGGVGGVYCGGKASEDANRTGKDPPVLPAHSSARNTTSREGPQQSPVNDHGSANAMVRARMLLDIADMVPWGMANRHLVSAADLGLATLLNIAGQACPESGEKGGGAAGGSTASEPADEDVGAQGSMGSIQSEPSSAAGATINGQGDGCEATAASNNAGVMPELSRLAPSGFLLPLVVGGATVLADLLTDLSSRRRIDGGGNGREVSGDAAADPSPLRAVHQLLLALRLLDLATLESSGEADAAAAAAAKATKDADPAGSPLSHHYAELTGALLLVVARCGPFYGASAPSDAAVRKKGKTPAGRFGQGRKQQQQAAPSPPQQPAVGGEVAGKVHQCLLAALRVLINVTHHDATICAEVGARRGLETLMSCLATQSCRAGRDSDAGDSRSLTPAHAKSDLELLGDVVNGAAEEDFFGAGSEEWTGDGGEADVTRGDFDAQVLTMSALINCVELKESAHNCAAMASLAVNPPAAAAAGRAAGGERTTGGRQQLQESRPCGLFSRRCLAPEFLAKLLIRSTRSFAHQLGAGGLDEDDEDGPASPAPSGTREHRGGGEAAGRRSTEGAGPSAASGTPSAAETMASAASAATPQEADGGEQLMSHAEGTDLVLGGHCALLLGLLVRAHESNRLLALPVLPDGDPTLIVRVLEAFMALQYQAGVLTEEIVLAVQGLVEDLEGLEAVPAKEWNPFEIDAADQDEDDAVSSSPPAITTNVDTVTTASPRRGRKRPRTAIASGKMPAGVQRTFVTPPSGQWASEGGEGNDSADDSQGEDASSLWLTQSPSSEETPPLELPEPSMSSFSSAPTKAAPDERPAPATTPTKASRGSDAGETPQSSGRTPGSTRAASSWRVAGSSIAGRIGMGLRGRSASTARNWLRSSPQLRTYRNRSIYGSQALHKASSSARSRAELNSSSSNRDGGKEAPVGRGERPSSAVFEILSDDSEESSEELGGGSGDGGGRRVNGGVGGAMFSIGGGGVGPMSGRSGPLGATATKSTFDLEACSDSSNDSPVQRKSQEAKARGMRVVTCQLHSLTSAHRKCGGSGTDGDDSGGDDDNTAAQWTQSDASRSRSPSPKAPSLAAHAAARGGSRPFQGFGPRSGSGLEISRAAASARATGVKLPARNRFGQANGEVTSRPIGRSSNNSAAEWRVGAGSHSGRQEGKSGDVLRVAPASRPSAPGVGGGSRGRLGGAKGVERRGGLGTEGAVGTGKGVRDKPASRNVFEMSDEDESD